MIDNVAISIGKVSVTTFFGGGKEFGGRPIGWMDGIIGASFTLEGGQMPLLVTR